MTENKDKTDSIIYSSLSLLVIILNFFFINYFQEIDIILVLIFFIIFFGLPHGALDTILAKRNNIYNNFTSFVLFNFIYLLSAFSVFCLWFLFPLMALSIFLIISIYHFSEDWKSEINLFQRIILSTSAVCLTAFFHKEEITLIFLSLTSSKDVSTIVSTLHFIGYFLLFFLTIIFFLNL